MSENKPPERALSEAPSEHSTLGAHIGLTERIDTNIALLKSMCAPDSLHIERFVIGKYTHTDVAVIHIPGIASAAAVTAITDKVVAARDYNYVPHIHAIEELIRPAGVRVFATSKLIERFGELSSDLMQGKIAVISDFTPFALVTPVTFFEQFQTPDDYFEFYGKFTSRIIRMLCFFFAVTLPAIYVALSAHHPGYIPERLFNNGELLSTFAEQLIVLTFWRVSVDSTVRVHQQLSIMLTVLMALVVGENLIATKIVNPDGIVIVAISLLFAFASVNEALKPLLTVGRYSLLIAAWLWGFPGIYLTCSVAFIYGCCLKPFGFPYMFPVVPFFARGFADTFFRGRLSRLWNGKRRL